MRAEGPREGRGAASDPSGIAKSFSYKHLQLANRSPGHLGTCPLASDDERPSLRRYFALNAETLERQDGSPISRTEVDDQDAVLRVIDDLAQRFLELKPLDVRKVALKDRILQRVAEAHHLLEHPA